MSVHWWLNISLANLGEPQHGKGIMVGTPPTHTFKRFILFIQIGYLLCLQYRSKSKISRRVFRPPKNWRLNSTCLYVIQISWWHDGWNSQDLKGWKKSHPPLPPLLAFHHTSLLGSSKRHPVGKHVLYGIVTCLCDERKQGEGRDRVSRQVPETRCHSLHSNLWKRRLCVQWCGLRNAVRCKGWYCH